MPPQPALPTEEELAATHRVDRLLDVPADARDDAWREAFLADLPLALFAFEPSFRGPDRFPYRVLRRVPPGTTSFTGGSIRHHAPEIMDALEGVAIEPREDGAEWVLSFGDLACDRMFGELTPPPEWSGSRPESPPTETLQEAEEAMVGSPNLEYLPEFVRVGLGEFLRAVGVGAAPRPPRPAPERRPRPRVQHPAARRTR